MKVKFHGYPRRSRPVKVDTGETIARNDLVQVDATGEVHSAPNAATSGLAVALDAYPDNEYEGTKVKVGLHRLSAQDEVEVPFTNTSSTETLAQADIDGGPFAYNATRDKIDLSTTASGVFVPTDVAYGSAIGDSSGYIIGYFIDSSVFGGN